MSVRFTIGHRGGGQEEVDVPEGEVNPILEELLNELRDSDDEHYQAYVNSADGSGMTIYDNGLLSWDTDLLNIPSSRYYRPATESEAVEILNAFVHQRPEAFAPRFGPEIPPPNQDSNYILAGMGEFALSRAAAASNFSRVQQLVEAGHDVNQWPPDSLPPLMMAVMEGNAGICEYLIEHGADVTVRLPDDFGWGKSGWGLLKLARDGWVYETSPQIAQMLEQAGAPE